MPSFKRINSEEARELLEDIPSDNDLINEDQESDNDENYLPDFEGSDITAARNWMKVLHDGDDTGEGPSVATNRRGEISWKKTEAQKKIWMGMSSVLCAALCKSDCGTAVVCHTSLTCFTYVETIFQLGSSLVQNAGCHTLYKPGGTIDYGDWTLVFKGQAYIQRSMMSVYLNTSHHDDNPLSPNFPLSCFFLDATNHVCDRHFRSSILDNWVGISQVRFSIYKDGSEDVRTIFNGSPSTYLDWFRQPNVVSSTFTGYATHSFEYFSLFPEVENRYFYSMSYHNGCPGDVGFTSVEDGTWDTCSGSWNLNLANFPWIIYSPTDRELLFATLDYKLGDFVAVFVKFQ